jgi:AraC family transcriptional regulator
MRSLCHKGQRCQGGLIVTLSISLENQQRIFRTETSEFISHNSLKESLDAAQSFASLFPAQSIKAVSTTSLSGEQILVARASGSAGTGISASFAPEKAYLVILQLQDCVGSELRKAGQLCSTIPFMAGSLMITHLEEDPTILLRDTFDFVALKIPETALGELADRSGAPRVGGLRSEARAHDAVLHHLARVMVSAVDMALEKNSPFFEHISHAVCLRLALNYGVPYAHSKGAFSGLGHEKMQLAKELLAADLTKQPDLGPIARRCGMPVGRFVRLFRQGTGLPPHRWLRAFRVRRAKDLMANGSLSLAQVAYECGFADQSHFTRVFSAAVNMTPAAWRRAHCN